MKKITVRIRLAGSDVVIQKKRAFVPEFCGDMAWKDVGSFDRMLYQKQHEIQAAVNKLDDMLASYKDIEAQLAADKKGLEADSQYKIGSKISIPEKDYKIFTSNVHRLDIDWEFFGHKVHKKHDLKGKAKKKQSTFGAVNSVNTGSPTGNQGPSVGVTLKGLGASFNADSAGVDQMHEFDPNPPKGNNNNNQNGGNGKKNRNNRGGNNQQDSNANADGDHSPYNS